MMLGPGGTCLHMHGRPVMLQIRAMRRAVGTSELGQCSAAGQDPMLSHEKDKGVPVSWGRAPDWPRCATPIHWYPLVLLVAQHQPTSKRARRCQRAAGMCHKRGTCFVRHACWCARKLAAQSRSSRGCHARCSSARQHPARAAIYNAISPCRRESPAGGLADQAALKLWACIQPACLH